MRNLFVRVSGLSLISFCMALGGVYAVTYPVTTPAGEQAGGWFQTYFDNMFTSEPLCNDTGKVVGGFTSTGVPLCVTPVASGLFVLGQTTGDTLRFDGTDWVRSNLIYNDGAAIGIGTQAPGATLDLSGSLRFSGGSPGLGKVLTSDASGIATWQTPTSATSWEILGNSGTVAGTNFLGTLDDVSLVFKVNNTKAGILGNTADSNTFYGFSAGNASNINLSSVAVGKNALFSNVSGGFNTAIGLGSLYTNTAGANNTANGYGALFLTTGGSNTAFGYNAGSTLTSGSNNIFIGAGTTPNIAVTASDQLNIGNWIYGNSGSIGIGVANPGAKLDIAGTIKITDGTQGSGKVLISDNNGLAYWGETSATSVTASGVIGGTESYVPKFGSGGNGLVLSQMYDDGSNIGIGTAVPGAKLDINGTIKISGGSPGVGKVLVSDALGLASWSVPPAATTVFATGVLAMSSSGGYVTKFMASGSGITNSVMYESGSYIGVNTTSPSTNLDVNGQIRLRTGASNGYMLISDANGLATWTGVIVATSLNISGATLGNTLYFNGTNWVASNNIYNSGSNVGIGTAVPGAKLEVAGQVKITGGSPGVGKALISDATGLASWGTPAAATTVFATGVLAMSSSGGYVTKFMASGSGITNSVMYESGSYIGVNTTSPSTNLDVNGQIRLRTGASSGLVLVSDTNGIGSWQVAPTATTVTATGITGGVQNYVPKFGTGGIGLYPSQIFDNGTNVGVGVPSPSYKLHVGGNAFFTGSVTVQGSLIVDKIVNRSVNNVSISGSLLPDATAPLVYRDIGTSTGRWNNLYLSGQVTIGGGSPGAGKFLVSDANGLASWTGLVTATSLNLSGAALGNTLYYNGTNWVFSNNIYNSGANVGIGTATPGAKLEVNGQVKITGGTPGAGKALISDATGLASWGDPAAATNVYATGVLAMSSSGGYVTKFMPSGSGITNSIMFESGSFLGINTTSPTAGLDINGQIRLRTGASAGFMLVSDVNGVASWTGLVTATSLSISGAVLGNTLYYNGTNWIASNNIYNTGGNVGIGITGTAPIPTSKFEVWSGGTVQSLLHFRGANNVGLGLNAVRYLTTGSANTGLGNDVLRTLSTGYSNSAFGFSAMYNNMQGYFNTAGGTQALYTNSDGNWNIALGSQALYTNLGGSYNVGIGGQSLYLNSGGSNNTAVGDNSLRNTTANNNTAIGYGAGSGITTGSNNIAIGATAQVYSNTASNQLSIGNWIYGSGGNIGIGTGTNITAKLTLDSGVNNTSGLRLSRVSATTPIFGGVAAPLGVDTSGNVVIAQQGAIPVYTALGATPGAAINTTTNPPTIGADYDKYFTINARQSFTVTDVGGNPYNCPEFNIGTTNKGVTGCTQTPWATYVMTAQNATSGDRYAYQILISDRVDAPFVVRGGMYDESDGDLENTAMTVPALWFKAITVPTNRSNWFYINPGVDQNNNPIAGGGNIGIGTTTPGYNLDIRGEVAMMNRVYLTGTTASAGSPTLSFAGDTNMGIFRPAADTVGISTSGTEAMRIFSNGNVTIGSSATNSTKLRVEGQVMITGGTPGLGKVLTSDATGLATWQTPSGGGGSGGTVILQATVNLNLPSIGNNACSLQTFNVPGAVTGKTAWISPASDLGSSTSTTLFIASVRVSAADTVEVKFCNESGSNVDRPAMDFYVSVIQ